MLEKLLTALCGVPEINEDNTFTPPRQYAIDFLSRYAAVQEDITGNIIATIGSGEDHVLVDAHIDQIGFVITGIEDNGFLRIDKSGGVDLRVLAGQEVYVAAKQAVYGIITCTPPHLKAEAEKAALAIDQFYIDTGLPKDQIEALVSLGDFAYFYTQPKQMLNRRFTASALDDRAGVAALLLLAQNIYPKLDELDITLTVMLSNQEELGCRGAATGAFSVMPKRAIAVDVSYGNQPDIPSHKTGELGGGVMIGVSPSLNKQIYTDLQNIARQHGIPFQKEVMGGETGTNADIIGVTQRGIPTGLLSIPLRNMHTPVECINLDDLQAVSDLLLQYILTTAPKREVAVC